jgi:hypothetical protein
VDTYYYGGVSSLDHTGLRVPGDGRFTSTATWTPRIPSKGTGGAITISSDDNEGAKAPGKDTVISISSGDDDESDDTGGDDTGSGHT